ncbi:G-box-binding factor 1 [Capsicum annuum]|nr:G-box-binding factor 1 [Capsicum annuum]KAF3652704.1 G-box-binding factor 1 [Capsicum annuum]
MGTGEESTPTKPSKATSTQEAQSTPSYPDWSSMQAYYGAGAAPPFFPSTVASPTPHPYMWGSQHPLMPPYGAPVPYPALYPPAGVYAHPNMPMTPNTLQTNPESDNKAPDGKDQNTSKKLKGSSGGKTGESGKAASGSGNDGARRSAESGSEGSSHDNDENDNHEFSADKSRSFDLMLANGANAQNNPATGNPVAMPATNLNIGMDLWNAPSAGPGMIKMRSNQPGFSPASGLGREWIQDERELKRLKRKQSNRESARRSRLRKQAECEELQHKVETLSNENHGLKEELRKLSEECEKLTSENNSIKDELTRLCGPEAVSKLESSSNAMHLQSNVEEANMLNVNLRDYDNIVKATELLDHRPLGFLVTCLVFDLAWLYVMFLLCMSPIVESCTCAS